MLIVELVLKALARSKSFSLIFILNFCLAIASLSYLQFFKASIDTSLDSQAKVLLGADLVVSSRFAITSSQEEAIKAMLPEIKDYTRGVSTVSMVASKKRSRLMEIEKINEGYPYYGGLVFADHTTYPNPNLKPKADEVWVYQEVLNLLGVELGGEVKIGNEQFVITKVIEEDSLKTISFSGFLPKIYISAQGLENTELLQFGSTARHKLNFSFVQDFDNDQLEAIENEIEKNVDRNVRVLSPNDGTDRLLRVLTFVTNFLSLVSLISFFLGLVGLIYLYSGFLRKHQKDITVLNDLGLSKKSLAMTYMLHLFVLITIATLIVFSLMGITAQFVTPLVEKVVDFDFVLSMDYRFYLQSALVLLLLSVSIGLPLILPLLQRKQRSFAQTLLHFIPFIVLLLLIAHFVTPAKNVGVLFALAMLAIIVVLFGIGSMVLKRLDFLGHLQSLSLSLAFKNIVRQRNTSLTLFTAIFLCTTFFSLIPQTGSSLSTALSASVEDRPRFFVIDAKEQELEAISATVSDLGGRLENISPMIRGRLSKINGVDFSTYSQNNANQEHQTQERDDNNRAVNLSYRDKLKESEEIVKGREFSGAYDAKDFSKPVEVSVEQRYADRSGIELGDRLVFDVLGLEINGVVVNIRSVKWTEFVPNFFFILQNGAINDAPKTMLATISSGDYDASAMLLKLSERFATLTVIDVKSLFESFAKLVDNVTSITDSMSLYSIVIGLVMSFIIIQYQMNLQKNNILRLKMIGVDNKTIRNSFLLEFGLLSFVASSLGIILGSVGSYIISAVLFESYWDFRPDILLLYLFFIPVLTITIVSFFTSKMIHQKENVLFGE